jgi:glutathione synthase/RimK-type ligase-like ATP-grasp enzyme
VLEVNAVPGWRALAPTTGIDVAKEIVEFLAEFRQRDERG